MRAQESVGGSRFRAQELPHDLLRVAHVDLVNVFAQLRARFRLRSGLGFRVQGSGCRIQGSGFRGWGLGFRDLGFRVQASG